MDARSTGPAQQAADIAATVQHDNRATGQQNDSIRFICITTFLIEWGYMLAHKASGFLVSDGVDAEAVDGGDVGP